MAEPVSNQEQITTGWLTERLRLNGYLERGEVSLLGIKYFRTLFSNIYQLEVTYSAEAARLLPGKLLLKVPLSDNEASLEMGKAEVMVYGVLASAMTDPPIVRCFDALYSEESRRSHLLLEDMSDTHGQPELPLPPALRHCELAVEALAQLHAFWWEHKGLGTLIGVLFDESSLRELEAQFEGALSGLMYALGDRLSQRRRRIYEKAMSAVPLFWARRLTSISRNTLIHGDAHTGNILHPKDTVKGRALLIDLATSNRIRPATNDLAYMMALQWFPERRAIMEEALLEHYHRALLSHGVPEYSWEDCRLDYRYSVLMHLFTPVLQWAGQLTVAVWWNNLERISEAFEDLRCDELL